MGEGVVGAWHGEVPVELTLEPSLPPATSMASKDILSFSQGPPEWGLALLHTHMAEALGA